MGGGLHLGEDPVSPPTGRLLAFLFPVGAAGTPLPGEEGESRNISSLVPGNVDRPWSRRLTLFAP